jgi:hypothetical protein
MGWQRAIKGEANKFTASNLAAQKKMLLDMSA